MYKFSIISQNNNKIEREVNISLSILMFER